MTGHPSRRRDDNDRVTASASAQPEVALRALIDASQEEARRAEREQIVRDLHNCIIRQVSSIQLHARALADYVATPAGKPASDPQRVRRAADELSTLATTALADLWDLVFGLPPAPEKDRTTLPPSALSTLTPRERDILALVAMGCSNQQIADRLGIRERTARTHVSNVLAKLHLTSRTQAALVAVNEGLADLTRLPDRSRQKLGCSSTPLPTNQPPPGPGSYSQKEPAPSHLPDPRRGTYRPPDDTPTGIRGVTRLRSEAPA